MEIELLAVTEANWREVADLQVRPDQAKYVAAPAYYLCLCHYGGLWQPLAIAGDGEIVGFVMWAVDDDASRWIGGLLIAADRQRQGIGRRALELLIDRLAGDPECQQLALSYAPDNPARALYAALGFTATGELDGDEVVARRPTR